MDDLKALIREVPDFPRPGINFYDLTTLLKDPGALRRVLEALTERFAGESVEKVVGIEARGFIFAPFLAHRLGAGFVPVRKPGRLPWTTAGHTYALEYGSGRLEVHTDAVAAGERVLVVDDLLATGGTADAAGRLVRALGGQVVGYGFVVELTFLTGRRRLGDARVEALLAY